VPRRSSRRSAFPLRKAGDAEDRMRLNRFALPLGLGRGRRFTSLVRKWAARPMTTAVATRRVRITAKKWNRALETFPEAAAIPRTGTRLRPSRVARMAPMRRGPFALAAPSASGAGALALRFSRDLEPISWGAESASQEPPRCCRKGLTRAGARLSPWAGGPSACRRHRRPSPGSPDYCLCRRVTRSSSRAVQGLTAGRRQR
jgi:hypothetical protein